MTAGVISRRLTPPGATSYDAVTAAVHKPAQRKTNDAVESGAFLIDPLHEPLRFAFLLAPNFSMMSLSSAIEPIRVANRLLGRAAFEWSTCSIDGNASVASNGLSLTAERTDDAIKHVDAMILCGGTRLSADDEQPIMRALRSAAHHQRAIGALSTATYLLAKAGLLSGYRCTIHWENMPALREDFPDLIVTENIYEIDRDRLTSSGGTTALDMMLQIILSRYGVEVASEVAAQFQHIKIRRYNEPQSGWRQGNLASLPMTLRRAVNAMRSNIEEPLEIREIARRAGLSQRQLERTFAAYLLMRPMHYYIMIRTERGRELLVYTEMPLISIAVAVGFGSVSRFSKWFRHFHGQSPLECRRAGQGRQ